MPQQSASYAVAAAKPQLQPIPMPTRKRKSGPFIIEDSDSGSESSAPEPPRTTSFPRTTQTKTIAETTLRDRKRYLNLVKTKYPVFAKRRITERLHGVPQPEGARGGVLAKSETIPSSSRRDPDCKIVPANANVVSSFGAVVSEPRLRPFLSQDRGPITTTNCANGRLVTKMQPLPRDHPTEKNVALATQVSMAGSTTMQQRSMPSPSPAVGQVTSNPGQTQLTAFQRSRGILPSNPRPFVKPPDPYVSRQTSVLNPTQAPKRTTSANPNPIHAQQYPVRDVSTRDPTEADALRKASNDKDTRDMQKLIRGNEEARSKKRETEQAEWMMRRDKEQADKKAAEEKDEEMRRMIEAAAEEQRLANVRSAVQENEKKKASERHDTERREAEALKRVEEERRAYERELAQRARNEERYNLATQRNPLGKSREELLQQQRDAVARVACSEKRTELALLQSPLYDFPQQHSGVTTYTGLPAPGQTVDGLYENSINGQAKYWQRPPLAKPSPFEKPPSTGKSHRAKAGSKLTYDLTLSDLKVYKRRQGGMSFKDIMRLYAEETGLVPADGTLRRRYNRFCDVSRHYQVDPEMIDAAALGDTHALAWLNRTVRQNDAQPPRIAKSSTQPMLPLEISTSMPPRGQQGVLDDEHEQDAYKSARQDAKMPWSPGLATRHPTSWFDNTTADAPQPHVRPTHGGKMMNEQAQIAYLEHLKYSHDEFEPPTSDDEDDDPVDDESSIISPANEVTDEDTQHFIYQVQRRECAAAGSDSDSDSDTELITDRPWLEHGRPFDNLRDANMALSAAALGSRPGRPSVIADAALDLAISRTRSPADGTLAMTVTSCMGVVEARVVRRERDAGGRVVLPLGSAASGLAPRRTFLVLQREVTHASTATTSNDDEDGSRVGAAGGRMVERTTLLDLVTHTTLRGANKRAVERWIKTTFTPSSRNLNEREVEIEAKREVLLIEFDVEGEGVPFRKHVRDESGVEYELWVEEGRLEGPRNL